MRIDKSLAHAVHSRRPLFQRSRSMRRHRSRLPPTMAWRGVTEARTKQLQHRGFPASVKTPEIQPHRSRGVQARVEGPTYVGPAGQPSNGAQLAAPKLLTEPPSANPPSACRVQNHHHSNTRHALGVQAQPRRCIDRGPKAEGHHWGGIGNASMGAADNEQSLAAEELLRAPLAWNLPYTPCCLWLVVLAASPSKADLRGIVDLRSKARGARYASSVAMSIGTTWPPARSTVAARHRLYARYSVECKNKILPDKEARADLLRQFAAQNLTTVLPSAAQPLRTSPKLVSPLSMDYRAGPGENAPERPTTTSRDHSKDPPNSERQRQPPPIIRGSPSQPDRYPSQLETTSIRQQLPKKRPRFDLPRLLNPWWS